MTVEEVRKELKSVRLFINRLDELDKTIQAEAAQKDGLTAISWTSPKVSGGGFTSPQERYVERMDYLKQQYNSLLEQSQSLARALGLHMQVLSFIESEVIINLYFRGYSIGKTAQILGKSSAAVRSAESRAVKAMSEYE